MPHRCFQIFYLVLLITAQTQAGDKVRTWTDIQGRTIEAQLRRFIGTRSGRKIAYARLLVDALELTRVPRPLDHLLAFI